MKEALNRLIRKIIPEREPPLSIIEKENFAKEAWFRAYYEGNSLIPQTEEGLNLCVAIATVLEDKYINWGEFSRSELSPKQLKILGDGMSEQHKHKNIDFSTEANAGNFHTIPKVVDEVRLKRLWTGTTVSVLKMLTQYIFNRNDIHGSLVLLVNQVKEVENFFGNERKNKIRIDQFKKALGVIATSLYESPTKELLTQYRDGFTTKLPTENRKEWMDVYLPNLKHTLISNLTKAFDGNLPKDIGDFIFRLDWHPPFD